MRSCPLPSPPTPPPPILHLRHHPRPSLPLFRRPPTLRHAVSRAIAAAYSSDSPPPAASTAVTFEVEKTGWNSRRIVSSVPVGAPLDAIWGVLTDYERLADFIPGLAVSRLLERADGFARLFQVGEQSLGLGIKFCAKGVLECYEGDVEVLPHCRKRDIEFKMVEGDFRVFDGKWSVLQVSTGDSEDCKHDMVEEAQSILSYVVDVEPKLWLPVGLVEGKLCKEVELNLKCIKEQAQMVFLDNLESYKCT